ncbi:MAG: thioesterase family protein [Oscillospiraceae bacterium]|nr:thioesterase family protein [Oscillospiraceae bacterium]
MEISVGLRGFAETTVEKEDTASVVGSGDLMVYATPCMAALMEGAAYESVAPYLAEGESTVGVSLTLKHLSATPVGMTVRAESTVTAIDGRKITFEIVASDEAGEIGRAEHERVIVKTDRFLEKAYDKL